ncbi:MAG: hypothetical protein ACK5R2_17640 [Cyanobacteriota bacterium]|jgi:hypothetical protein
MNLNRLKCFLIVFYFLSFGHLFASTSGDDTPCEVDSSTVSSFPTPRRSVSILTEFRDSLDEIIRENGKVVSLEASLGKLTEERDAALTEVEELKRRVIGLQEDIADAQDQMKSIEQLRKERSDMLRFSEFLIKARNLKMIDYFRQAFFSPDCEPGKLERLLGSAERDTNFSHMVFASYGSSSSLPDVIELLGGIESGGYSSPSGYHSYTDFRVRGTPVSKDQRELFSRVRGYVKSSLGDVAEGSDPFSTPKKQ